MRLGWGVHFQNLPPAPGGSDTPVLRYAALLARAARAEALGFDSVWVGERADPGEEGIPAALPVCAALASGTRRVRLGTAVLPLPLYHPLRVAEDAATIDGVSGGRFELGVGLGGDPGAFHGFGVPRRERAGRLEEAISVLRKGLGGSPVGFHGRHYRVHDLVVVPQPAQTGGPPLWIGASAQSALRRVARLGEGLIAPGPEVARRFLRAWLEEGRDPARARVALGLPWVVGRAPAATPVEAGVEVLDVETARKRLAGLLGDLHGLGRLEILLPGAPRLEASLVETSLAILASELRAEFSR